MKYISDQSGIMDRYLREQDNWTAHLENTKQFILESFDEMKNVTVAVLGSGWLLDLPLKSLAATHRKVLLVDAFHPPQVCKKVGKYSNVELFETDLTGGGMKFCWELRKAKDEHLSKYILDDFKPEKPVLPYKPDAVVSLNILNQLDVLLVDFLKRKNVNVVESEIRSFRRKIQQFHIDWITGKPGCLITDTMELVSGYQDGNSEKRLVHVELPEGRRTREWIWDFDLSGTYHAGKETRMKVNAVEW